jgi:hypothetical protein
MSYARQTMNAYLGKFSKLESKIIDGIAKRAQAVRARGEKIHVVGVRRQGDDDGSLGFSVAVDPMQSGVKKSYEPRDDAAARLWSLDKDGPAELKKLVRELAEEHEDLDPDDLPGRSLTEPHAILTCLLDSIARKLAAALDAPVALLDTEAIPIDDGERAELREWAQELE